MRTQQVDPDLERTGGMADGASGSVLELRIVEGDMSAALKAGTVVANA